MTLDPSLPIEDTAIEDTAIEDTAIEETSIDRYSAEESLPASPRWYTVVRTLTFFLGYLLISGVASLFTFVLAAIAFGGVDSLDTTDPYAFTRLPLGEAWGDAVLALVTLTGVLVSVPLVVAFTWLMVRYVDRGTLADVGCRWPLARPTDGQTANGQTANGQTADGQTADGQTADSQTPGTRGKPSLRLALRRIPLWLFGTAGLLGLWLALAATGGIEFGGLSATFTSGPAPLPGIAGSVLVLLALFVLFLIQGSAEEWAFRGYIQSTVQRSWGFLPATLVSSLLFMVVHMSNPGANPFGMINTFLIGIVFAQLWQLTGSLWAPALVHGAWNFFLGTFVSLPVSGLEILPVFDLQLTGPWWLTGDTYGAEGSAFLTALSLLLIAGLAVLLRGRSVPRAAPHEGDPGAQPATT